MVSCPAPAIGAPEEVHLGAVTIEAGAASQAARPPVNTKTVLATERSETSSSAPGTESVSSVPTEIASSVTIKVVSPVAIKTVSSVTAVSGISPSDETPDKSTNSLITRWLPSSKIS